MMPSKEVRTPCELAWGTVEYVPALGRNLDLIAQMWADIADLRCETGGSVEDAILQCMFYLWCLENFDEEG